MLEILAIWFLGKKVASMAENKGYSGGLFLALFVIGWFGCEVLGFIVGAGMSHGDNLAPAYMLGLFGACMGALLVFVIAAMLPEGQPEEKIAFDLDGRPIYRNRRPRRKKKFRRRVRRDEEEVLDVLPVKEEEEEEQPRTEYRMVNGEKLPVVRPRPLKPKLPPRKRD